MKVIKLSENDLNRIIKKVLQESNEGNTDRYMFFSNLEQIRRQCDMLLEQDPQMLEQILDNGHDWAQDHIAEAKNNMDQVFDFLMNEIKGDGQQDIEDMSFVGMMEESSEINEKKKKNTPTNPQLWQQSLSWARSRYKVCPSAYCHGAAAKKYKSKGGKWTKK